MPSLVPSEEGSCATGGVHGRGRHRPSWWMVPPEGDPVRRLELRGAPSPASVGGGGVLRGAALSAPLGDGLGHSARAADLLVELDDGVAHLAQHDKGFGQEWEQQINAYLAKSRTAAQD